MKISILLDKASQELLNATNQIMMENELEPSLMQYALLRVSERLNDMKATELSEDERKMELEIKRYKTELKKYESKAEAGNPVPSEETHKAETKVSTKVEHQRKSIDEFLADAEAAGVKVTKEESKPSMPTSRVETINVTPEELIANVKASGEKTRC